MVVVVVVVILNAIGLSPGGSSPTLVQTKIHITQNKYKTTKYHKTTK